MQLGRMHEKDIVFARFERLRMATQTCKGIARDSYESDRILGIGDACRQIAHGWVKLVYENSRSIAE